MKKLLQMVSYLGLGFTVVPSFLVMGGQIPWDAHATLMLIGMVLWFASAPFWMRNAD